MTMAALLIAVVITLQAPHESAAPSHSATSANSAESAELVPVPVPEPSERAMEYYRSGIAIWFGVQAWRLAIPAVILFSGFSARLRTFAKRLGRSWFGTIAVYLLAFYLITFVIELPLDYFLGYVRPHHYELSRQSLGRWIGNEFKSLAIGIVAAIAFVWIPFLVIARSPKRWWLYTGMLALPFAIFTAFVMPIWIDPLFNAFGPMKNKALEAQILSLADRAGIDGSRVFEIDKSRDTKTVNAYVTGLFGSKRIVLWDTLLANQNDKEVLAVMGHEMGHFVLNHVAWGISLGAAGSLILLFLVDRLGRWSIARFGNRFGFDSLADIAALPLFIFLRAGLNLIGSPIQLAISRTMEHEADRFSLELTHTNHSAASAFAKLQRENLSNPRPGWLSVIFRSSHPPLGERIDFCNVYHPWTSGLSGRYDSLFRSGTEQSKRAD